MANVRKVPFEPDSIALYPTMCTCKSLHVCVIEATQMYTQAFHFALVHGSVRVCVRVHACARVCMFVHEHKCTYARLRRYAHTRM